MTQEELRRTARSVGQRSGWDFSRMRDRRDPVPWDYLEVVCRYLKPSDRILDVGTGGGEKLLQLAPFCATAVGIDADSSMVVDAQWNLGAARAGNVSFQQMSAEDLRFDACSFDVVLNRHSAVDAREAARVLRVGGFFITQQVGERNTQNICAKFECGVGGQYAQKVVSLPALADEFTRANCQIRSLAEYDVPYWFCDVESLIFWHMALPMPEDFDIERHWRHVDEIIVDYSTSRGIESNEHRALLVAQKL